MAGKILGFSSDLKNRIEESERRRMISNPLESLWYKIVIISFMNAVSLDPLFFYIPIIHQDNNCLGMDKNLRNISLILRLLTDIIALVHLLHRLRLVFIAFMGNRSRVLEPLVLTVKALFITSIGFDVLALLPIPLLIWGSRSLEVRQRITITNVCVLAQYLPRMLRIPRVLKKIRKFDIRVKAIVYGYLYILTSHILGAVWYSWSIKRWMSCSDSACRIDIRNCNGSFDCNRPTNITFLNEHCPIDIPDGASSAPFDFGIYLDALKIATVQDASSRIIYCFWWGLRNLSNFGTNLTTSTHVGENLFAILISVSGFVVLTVIAATVQVPVRDAKRRKIFKELDSWISGNELPHDLKTEILSSLDKKLKENKDDYLKNDLFSILPEKPGKSLKHFLCMKILKTVPQLERTNTEMLEMICHYLKPVVYDENRFIFRMGDPLDCMLFIIQGTMWTYSGTSSTSATSSEMAARRLGKGQFYGEELLNSASSTFTQLPISTQHVKTREKVQAFALMADDLATVIAKCQPDTNNNSQEVEDDMVEI